MRIAIVGAGMAGLSCAESLVRDGHDVTLFDKGSRPGGRTSTKSLATSLDGVSFDYGAQYMSVRDPAFKARVARWQEAGIVARWPAAGDDVWVGTPGMSAPVADMASRCAVRWSTHVEALASVDAEWRLCGEGLDAAAYAAVVVAIPAEQVAPLLKHHSPGLTAAAADVPSRPCLTVMVAFAEPLPLGDIIKETGPIGWAARDSSKPGRVRTGGVAPEAWVIQAGPDWSADHLDDDRDAVTAELLAALSERCGRALPSPLAIDMHRWRYAKSGRSKSGRSKSGRSDARFLWDAGRRLGVCGDWLIGPRVEAAWLSGAALAEAIAADPGTTGDDRHRRLETRRAGAPLPGKQS